MLIGLSHERAEAFEDAVAHRPRDPRERHAEHHDAACHELAGIAKISANHQQRRHRRQANDQHHQRRADLGVIDHGHAHESEAEARSAPPERQGSQRQTEPDQRGGRAGGSGRAGGVGQTARAKNLAAVGRLIPELARALFTDRHDRDDGRVEPVGIEHLSDADGRAQRIADEQ
jgi:hypothetical protein